MEFEIKVPEDRVDLEYSSVFKEIQKNAKIDGFRKGKVPIQIIEKKFEKQADREVAENLLKSEYIDIIKEKKLTPIGTPEFDFEKIKKGEFFSFKVKFEVVPTVELGEYKNVNVDYRRLKNAPLPCQKYSL